MALFPVAFHALQPAWATSGLAPVAGSSLAGSAATLRLRRSSPLTANRANRRLQGQGATRRSQQSLVISASTTSGNHFSTTFNGWDNLGGKRARPVLAEAQPPPPGVSGQPCTRPRHPRAPGARNPRPWNLGPAGSGPGGRREEGVISFDTRAHTPCRLRLILLSPRDETSGKLHSTAS